MIATVAPDLRVGRGLEHSRSPAHRAAGAGLRPTFGLGEDWNRHSSVTPVAPVLVAPDLRVGRGLELRHPRDYRLESVLRPTFGLGEDWNVLPELAQTLSV